MINDNACGACQNCCKGTVVRATVEDIARWRFENRYDIMLCLKSFMGSDAFLVHKKDVDECIFLTAKGCEIYATRPAVCRAFPKSKEHALPFNCQLRR